MYDTLRRWHFFTNDSQKGAAARKLGVTDESKRDVGATAILLGCNLFTLLSALVFRLNSVKHFSTVCFEANMCVCGRVRVSE